MFSSLDGFLEKHGYNIATSLTLLQDSSTVLVLSGAHKGRSVQRHSRVGRIIVGE